MAIVLSALIGRKTFQSSEASGANGLLYADSFTENSARHEWKLGVSSNTAVPALKNDSLYFSGSGVVPCAAILGYELPEAFDLYFTAYIARRGGDGRDPTVFLNVGENFGERYQIWLSEESVKLTLNYNDTIAIKKVEGLKSGGAYSFRLSVKGAELKIYFDGAEDPCIRYTASGDYASLAHARYFGINCYASEFYFDNLVVTDGKNLIPITDLMIGGENGKSKIDGIGTSLQMMAYMNPSNPTDPALVWSVDDKNLASITTDGLLTAKGQGTVTVTAKTRTFPIVSASKKIKITGKKSNSSDTFATTTAFGKILADDYIKVFESPSPTDIYTFSPALCVLDSGRIIATSDWYGSGLSKYTPVGYDEPQNWEYLGRVAYSDDGGKTWKYPFDGPFLFAQPFKSGKDVYIVARSSIDHSLVVYRSQDEGKTWSEGVTLDSRTWHSAPTAPIYKDGYIYMTMEIASQSAIKKGYSGRACLAPILMRAKEGEDLTKKENWAFSSEMAYSDVVEDSMASNALNYTGIPYQTGTEADVGWLEGNVIQIYDKNHQWYDESGKTFYIYLRGSTLGNGFAAIMKVVEGEDGKMLPSIVSAPSGKAQIFIPMPGGNDKFYILYDTESARYWLLSNYVDDSMAKKTTISPDRTGDPANQRDKLALYFSKNAVDWSFAGFVSCGKSEKEARSYASMAIEGKDLLVLSRSGDENAESSHNTNIITLHRVKNFRDLIY